MQTSDSRMQGSKADLQPISEEETPRTQQASVSRLRHDPSGKSKGQASRAELQSNATRAANLDPVVNEEELLQLCSQSSSNGQEQKKAIQSQAEQSHREPKVGVTERLEVEDVDLYQNSKLRSTIELVKKPGDDGAQKSTSNLEQAAVCLPSKAGTSEDQNLSMRKQNLNEQSERSKQDSESGSGKNPVHKELNEREQQQTSQDETISDPKQDGLIHRLPQNYFMEDDDDEGDMEQVISNIQNMRNQMLSYVQETQIDKELNQEINDIANIIEPERFIEKHYGERMETTSKEGPVKRAQSRAEETHDAGPPKFLFEEILKDTPTTNIGKQLREQKTEKAFLSTFNEQSEAQLAQKPPTEEATTEDRVINSKIEEDQSKKGPIVDFWGNDNEIQINVEQQHEDGNEGAAMNEPEIYEYQGEGQAESKVNIEDGQAQEYQDVLPIDGFAPQELGGVTLKASQAAKSPGPRMLKMADYFAASEGKRSERQTTNEGQARSWIQPAQSQSAAVLDGAHLQQCEKELLDNVAINFLFTKGSSLSQGLIDIDRVYEIVEKIKEIAREQITQGSRDINFDELVEFLKTRDSEFIKEAQNARASKEQELSEQEKQARWEKVVGFMRNNPRLLMQMIPDSLEDVAAEEGASTHAMALGPTSSMRQADMVLKRSRVYDKIQEAQSWQQQQHKLQQLSQNFMQNRGPKHPLRPAQAPRFQPQPRPFSGGLPQQQSSGLSKINKDSKQMRLHPTRSQVHKDSAPFAASQRKSYERPPKPCTRQPPAIVSKPVSIRPTTSSRRLSKNSEPTGILRKDSFQHKRPKLKPQEKYQALKPVLMEKGKGESIQGNDMETPGPLENISKASDYEQTSGQPEQLEKAHHVGGRVSSARRVGRAAQASEGAKAQSSIGRVSKEQPAEANAPRPRKIEPQRRGKSDHQESRWSHKQFDKNDNLESLAKPRIKKESALANSGAVPNAPLLQDSGAHTSGLSKPHFAKPPQKFIDPNNMRWKIKADPTEPVSHSDANFENDQNSDQQGLFSNKTTNPRFRVAYRPITAKAGPHQMSKLSHGLYEGPGMPQIGAKQRDLNTDLTNKFGSRDGSRDHPPHLNVHDQFSSNSRSRPHQQREPPQALRSLLGNSNMLASSSASHAQDGAKKDSNSSQLKPISSNPPKFIKVKSFGAKRQRSNSKLGEGDTMEAEKNRARKTYYQPCKFNPLISQPISEQMSTGWIQDGATGFQARPIIENNEQSQSGTGQSHRERLVGEKDNAELMNGTKSHRSFTSQDMNRQSNSRAKDLLPPLQHVGKYSGVVGPNGLPLTENVAENLMYQSKLRSQAKIESHAAENLAAGDYHSHVKSANFFPSSDQQAEQSGKSRSLKSPAPGAKRHSSKSSPKTRKTGSSKSPTRASRSPNRSQSRKRAKKLDLPKTEQNVGTSTTELQHKQYEKVSRQAERSETSPAKKSKKKKVDFDKEDGVSGASQMVRCEMSVQTNIKGLEHRILIRPDKFDADPFKEEAPSESGLEQIQIEEGNLSQHDSAMTSGRRSKSGSHYRVPVINWSESPLYSYFTSHSESPDTLESDNSRYTEEEVEQVLQMVKNSYSDFQRTDLMKPFYLKARQTLQFLLKEQMIEPIFDRVSEVYKEVTLENAMKLLIRCKLAFNSRSMLMKMFKHLSQYRTLAEQLKALVAVQPGYFVEQQTHDEITSLLGHMSEALSTVISQSEVLSNSSHRQLKGKSFVFEHKDAIALIKVEMGEARRLVDAFAVADGKEDENISDRTSEEDEEKNQKIIV